MIPQKNAAAAMANPGPSGCVNAPTAQTAMISPCSKRTKNMSYSTENEAK